MMKKRTTPLGEWIIVILCTVLVYLVSKVFMDMSGVSINEIEDSEERLGMIVGSLLPAYMIGTIPAGYIAAHKIILGSFFGPAFLGINTITYNPYEIGTWQYFNYNKNSAGGTLGIGLIAMSISLPFLLAILVGMFAYPWYLFRRILGLFIHSEEALDKAMRILYILILIIIPICVFVVAILMGFDIKTGLIVSIAGLLIDVFLLIVALVSKIAMKKNLC